MSEKLKKECPDLYRRLKLQALRAGESLGGRMVYKGR